MDEHGAFTAALLDSSRKAYAAGAILRVQEAGPEAARFVESWGFDELVQDAQLRLEHLSEALACGRSEVFSLDIEWLGTTYAARDIPPELLKTTLRCLQAELEESLPPGSVSMPKSFLQDAIDRLDRPPAPAPSYLEANGPHVETARRFLGAVLEGEPSKAKTIVFDAIDAGMSIAEAHQDVIAKAQAEVGRMWQAGEIHVAEEHLGSRIVEDVLAQLRHRMEAPEPGKRCVLTASVSGNLHDIGARIVADQFSMHGWRSIFLGANMPRADLVQATRDFEPDLIALSVGLAINLRAAAATIAAVREASPDTPILVGGRPFAFVADLWKDVGADGCALDASEAVRVGRDLVAA